MQLGEQWSDKPEGPCDKLGELAKLLCDDTVDRWHEPVHLRHRVLAAAKLPGLFLSIPLSLSLSVSRSLARSLSASPPPCSCCCQTSRPFSLSFSRCLSSLLSLKSRAHTHTTHNPSLTTIQCLCLNPLQNLRRCTHFLHADCDFCFLFFLHEQALQPSSTRPSYSTSL